MYFLGVNEDDEDDVSSLWEEVRGDRPPPPPPPPAPPKAKAPGGRRRSESLNEPQNWLFVVSSDPEEGHTVVFTPLAYWQREGAAYDQELPENIKGALPGYLDEVSEATYVANTDLTAADIREDLRRNGFIENSAFTDWVQGAALLDDS